MKLYVYSTTDTISDSPDKIYLDVTAKTRNELTKLIGSEWFALNNQQFHIREVRAERTDVNNITSGAVIGGFVGTLAGPIGMFFGSIIGGAIGNSSDEDEKEKVELFNNSLTS